MHEWMACQSQKRSRPNQTVNSLANHTIEENDSPTDILLRPRISSKFNHALGDIIRRCIVAKKEQCKLRLIALSACSISTIHFFPFP